jgi:ATP-dependent Clp protease ATP-binding subunit ClpB
MRNCDDLEDFLRQRIRGQEQVITPVSNVISRGEMGLSKSNKPKGSLLLLGPTGVGKTETCLGICDYLYGDTKHLARFDMAEYQRQDDLGRLIGNSSSDQGFLGDAVDRLNELGGGLCLFDEIEKAHQNISLLFLGILDAARATMSNGSVKDFSGLYLAFSSNLGSAEAIRMHNLPYTSLRRHVLNSASDFFRPELLARFQEKLVYNRLDYEVQIIIAEDMLRKELAHIRERTGLTVATDESALQRLIRMGFDKYLGARPLRDTIERELGNLVIDYLRHGGRKGDDVRLTTNEQQLVLVKDTSRIDIFAEDIFSDDEHRIAP